MKLKCVETTGGLFVVGGIYEKNESDNVGYPPVKAENKGNGVWTTNYSVFHELAEPLVCVSFTGKTGIFTPGKSYDCERAPGMRLFIVQDDLVSDLDKPDWYEVCQFDAGGSYEYQITYKGGSASFKRASHIKNADDLLKPVFDSAKVKQSISNAISGANEGNRIAENKKRHSAFYGALGASIYDEKPMTPELYRELHAWAFDSTKS